MGIESAKWYNDQLEVMLEVPKADGKGMTNATLAHAKKYGFLPSVTSILDILDARQLTEWKIEHNIKACAMFPFAGDIESKEEIDKYIAMIGAKASEYGKIVADIGKQLHGDVEIWIRSMRKALPEDPVSRRICNLLDEKFNELGIVELLPEQKFGSKKLGYAGTPDIWGRRKDKSNVIIDLKTTTLRTFKTPYDKWLFQLGGYYGGICVNEPTLMLQAVADRETGDVKFIDYEGKTESYWKAFQHIYELYCIMKNYDPRKG